MNYNVINQMVKNATNVCQYAKVENGIATATNLYISIQWKTHLIDGYYLIEDLKNGLMVTEKKFDSDSFFPLTPEVKITDFTVLDNDIFHAANYCDCSKEENKKSLQYIHIKDYLEASNGHVVFRKKIESESEKLIHKDIIYYAKCLKMQDLKYAENEDHYIVFDDNYKITSIKCGDNYPDMNKVIPLERKYKTYLKQWPQIYTTYKNLVNKDSRLLAFNGDIVRTGEEKSVYSKTDNDVEINIGFNIEYMNLLQKTMKELDLDLKMEYESNIGIVLFRNDLYTLLIMPMKILDEIDIGNFTEIPLKNATTRKKSMPFLDKEIKEIAGKKKISKKQAMDKIRQYIQNNIDDIVNEKLNKFLKEK